MSLTHSGTITTSSTSVINVCNVPSASQVLVHQRQFGSNVVNFGLYDLTSFTQTGSNFCNFTYNPSTATAYDLAGMDFITSSKAVVAFTNQQLVSMAPVTLTEAIEIWTIDIGSHAAVKIGTLYNTRFETMRVVGQIASGTAIIAPNFPNFFSGQRRRGEIGFATTSTNTATLMKPSWLANYHILEATTYGTTGYLLCCSYPESDTLTFIITDTNLNFVSQSSVKLNNFVESDISSVGTTAFNGHFPTRLRELNGYAYLSTTKALYLIDVLTGTVLQCQPNLGGYKASSHFTGPGIFTASEPYIHEYDAIFTPMAYKGAFYTGADQIHQMDVNSSANALWYWSTPVGVTTTSIEVCAVSSIRSVVNEPASITDGSPQEGEVIFIDDSVSPSQVMFATTVPVSGRNVPLTTGKSIIGISHYGDGVDERFDINRITT